MPWTTREIFRRRTEWFSLGLRDAGKRMGRTRKLRGHRAHTFYGVDSAVPSGLGVFGRLPGSKLPGYCQRSLRDRGFEEPIQVCRVALPDRAFPLFRLLLCFSQQFGVGGV